ncbi:conserved hypothetical protein [Yersinia pestis Pestoides F]|uniref:Uncharacterized protein n=1 Tax=Yersinia pestis TaxID=632 RepID=Q8CLQ1_YERPE|nr:hypothetical [Yersinia pestis KIM10+]ABP41960.1 conserved hypothetical protein [Yersinia pestis Pestoides F]EIR39177.1 hypothetical protein YPPY12_0690 [Yersinia pestis PY-12]EIS36479.1 hypothetical protein YPPY54_0492 [Yersinia pestis PY-54]EIS50089.1 hypothetical protein YPPY58_0491 [Yersinia pestis PY-58]EIT04242.1 hypothetical protein YPPY90_0574 [Yersinia pestis PY-90]
MGKPLDKIRGRIVSLCAHPVRPFLLDATAALAAFARPNHLLM